MTITVLIVIIYIHTCTSNEENYQFNENFGLMYLEKSKYIVREKS